MALYELSSKELNNIEKTTFAMANIKERSDLQRLLRTQIEAIVPDVMVLAEEFGNWEDSSRRIDLLAIDKSANLVVIELKRTEDGGHMELQSLRYAAMLSAMTWEQAVEAHRHFAPTIGLSAETAEERMLEFLEWEEPYEEKFANDVRIVLASANFSRELTTAVLWLNERGLDIRCVRMVPYSYSGQVLLDVQTVIPLPEAEEYQIRVREKAQQERASRREHSTQQLRLQRFWAGLLEKANAQTDLHKPISPGKTFSLPSIRHGIGFNYRITKNAGRVALWIQRSSPQENKAIFDTLYQHLDEIDKRCGKPLDWRRNDNGKYSRVRLEVSGGCIDDETTWESLQTNLVKAMRILFNTFEPYVKEYREGASPVIALNSGDRESQL